MKKSYDLRNFTEEQFVNRVCEDMARATYGTMEREMDAMVRSVNRSSGKNSFLNVSISRKKSPHSGVDEIRRAFGQRLRAQYRENFASGNTVITIDLQMK